MGTRSVAPSRRLQRPTHTHTHTMADLAALNTFLADHSYADGFVPSQVDVTKFAEVPADVDAAKFKNVARRQKHIASFSDDEKKSWPAAGAVASAPKEEKKAAKKDDDDFDLFDDDTAAEEEYERQLAERAKATNEKRAKKAVVAKSL